MADAEKAPATLLDELAALDPPQRREVAKGAAECGQDLPRSGVAVARGGIGLATVSGETINGIPRVDPGARRGVWKRAIQRLVATRPGAAVHRMIAAPLDAPIMRASGGRVNLAVGVLPVVMLTSTGAHSGQRRETPLVYFTDGDDVILTASNYGGARHPSWYYNLIARPECELHIGPRGGRFVAREIEGGERDRLFALAVDLYPGYANYAQRTDGIRTIQMLRLTPAS